MKNRLTPILVPIPAARSSLRRTRPATREPSAALLAAAVALTALGFACLTGPTARQGLPAVPAAAAARVETARPSPHHLPMRALPATKPDVPLTGW